MTKSWPNWWDWELDVELPHLQKRMRDRGFSEADLRQMMEGATGYCADHETGRYQVHTRHGGRPWVVIVEPDPAFELLIVVTAYPKS